MKSFPKLRPHPLHARFLRYLVLAGRPTIAPRFIVGLASKNTSKSRRDGRNLRLDMGATKRKPTGILTADGELNDGCPSMPKADSPQIQLHMNGFSRSLSHLTTHQSMLNYSCDSVRPILHRPVGGGTFFDIVHPRRRTFKKQVGFLGFAPPHPEPASLTHFRPNNGELR